MGFSSGLALFLAIILLGITFFLNSNFGFNSDFKLIIDLKKNYIYYINNIVIFLTKISNGLLIF
ncbi:hypothetical protein CO115_02410 [Candidatus Falkowbacteria bacterium CG_4_9_14_3_um_filter_36_9]|uniref:Uncharacterized protein n=1 Tax=Candidatus Falkowbacteria bacterium CG02_land_8_20_14_3_00_36_14 TaxID=1974560 RepID=A0A2M7DKX8_9BACT|nr:MAG: hypothetical protein COS18_05085 [Candidatus Falkowbacteria bacterium CG02_land_8_20_14_3_00_36_14]PIX11076.1 MAG: hypothetical protein COZ73_03655 [Candidatus Falkowbacteria bacterium CG_4_8_14_3_um_filter_36_11]PJA10239.1 MAG: hypothetical protein COX67_05105 [Candidatus Falkowbacteria bacterium CG_4_10_14_0_2_um_filter_36_22]PJB19669.1 MAG: hypothetical protein CO115_02410 [Candidatus Falkowbacteria bacterium CG_4_9_14_3_um_filter_36_9]